MEEFYVQVMSHASTAEFPSNQANSFKSHLPNLLESREAGWKVGLSDLSLPAAIRKMNLKDPWLFQNSWIKVIDAPVNLYAHNGVHEHDRQSIPVDVDGSYGT